MIPFLDVALEPIISWPSLVFWAVLFILIYLRNRWNRIGPTPRQSLILIFILILSVIPFLLLLMLLYQGMLFPDALILIAFLIPFVTFYLLAFIAAFGTKKEMNLETITDRN